MHIHMFPSTVTQLASAISDQESRATNPGMHNADLGVDPRRADVPLFRASFIQSRIPSFFSTTFRQQKDHELTLLWLVVLVISLM